MASLDNVVEVFHLSVVGVGGAFALLLQLANGLAMAARLVGVDHVGLVPGFAAAQGFAGKPLGGFRVAVLGLVEIDGVPVAVNGAIQIRPFALDLDDAISAVPSDGPQNDLAPEVPPLEVMGHGKVSKSTIHRYLAHKDSWERFLQQGRSEVTLHGQARATG